MQTRLVGRELEREEGLRLIGRADAGHGGTLIIRGPTGIGKTRLINELAADASGAGLTVLRTAAIEDGVTSPLLPLRRMLARHLQSLDPEVGARLTRGLEAVLRASSRTSQGAVPPQGSNGTTYSSGLVADRGLHGRHTPNRAVRPCFSSLTTRTGQTGRASTLRSLAARLPGAVPAGCGVPRRRRAEAPALGGSGFGSGSPGVTELRLGPLDWINRAVLAPSPGGGAEVELTDSLFAFTGGNPLYLEHAARGRRRSRSSNRREELVGRSRCGSRSWARRRRRYCRRGRD
jgi:hypothetical protein